MPNRTRTARLWLALISCATMLLLASPADARRTVYATATAAAISALEIQPDGSLTTVAGSPFTTGDFPRAAVISPDRRFLFVANRSDQSITVFGIGAAGELISIPGSTVPSGGTGPTFLALTPDGRRLYVGNQSEGSITAFSVGDDGALTLAGAKVTITPFPVLSGVGVTPDGRHLYAVDSLDGEVYGYAIGGGGELTPLTDSPFAVGGNAISMKITPDGRHIYMPANAGGIFAAAIAPDGGITPLPGSPFAPRNGAFGVAITSDGARLYTANHGPDNVSAFSIGPGGALVPITGSPFASGTDVIGIAVTPAGDFLYAGPSAGGMFGHTIGAAGALTTIPGSPFSTGTTGQSAADGVVITPNRGPVAAFAASSAQAGADVPFDARGSFDPDGQIARYDWDFGDGTALGNGGATPSHAYARPGDYTVTMTVTDNEGCSTALSHNGQMALCAGGPAARIQRTVSIRDTVAPRLDVARSGRGLPRRVSLSAACDEQCSLAAGGTIAVATPGERKRRFALAAATGTAVPGRAETLTLELSKKSRARARRALRRDGSVKLLFAVTATDQSGNMTARTLSDRLR